MRAHPVDLVATLACGLRRDSRIMTSLRGDGLTFTESVLVHQLDAMRINSWLHSEDARKGRNRPESVYNLLTRKQEERDFAVFDSIEEFEAALKRSKE